MICRKVNCKNRLQKTVYIKANDGEIASEASDEIAGREETEHSRTLRPGLKPRPPSST